MILKQDTYWCCYGLLVLLCCPADLFHSFSLSLHVGVYACNSASTFQRWSLLLTPMLFPPAHLEAISNRSLTTTEQFPQSLSDCCIVVVSFVPHALCGFSSVQMLPAIVDLWREKKKICREKESCEAK